MPFQFSISPFDDIFQDECPLNLQQDHCLFHVLYFDEGIWLGFISFCVGSYLFHVLHLNEGNQPIEAFLG